VETEGTGEAGGGVGEKQEGNEGLERETDGGEGDEGEEGMELRAGDREEVEEGGGELPADKHEDVVDSLNDAFCVTTDGDYVEVGSVEEYARGRRAVELGTSPHSSA
jgi:hypothetical protein